MSDLTELKCEACQIDAPMVTESEMTELTQAIPAWQVLDVNGIKQLERAYKFKNFKQAWAFADKVAEMAEEEFHHPTITLEWGKVTVNWWSHSIKGLHKNDFICAAKTDRLSEN
ncbi:MULTISPECIES: 4a-hydroxytetrahydrobiopterin dehydratase [unclassified Photobacterium]|uniref:4a-hydroxytetrahydrobiopterin dehydratase n=1 Tax=unclassified Photobacterium TaxID=2628852 RepID=UPI001B8BA399|nr:MULTISPECIES: 4a-hydroxytetrahydrobiopterin dehydratase [unclassified Photobacterium]MDO6706087.1 4a-hydroxytetrahydrobiopterin dehydratase [Photobacterium sp. 1_MG-2023]QUJ69446.1 4a-hydroxytetrahydrobiopterin dehydratase [Photobacterium sp. GJ3]